MAKHICMSVGHDRKRYNTDEPIGMPCGVWAQIYPRGYRHWGSYFGVSILDLVR